MYEYVLIDTNNGHCKTFYNFKSNATEEQIKNVTDQMLYEHPSYLRVGSNINDLAVHLVNTGFTITIEENARDRQHTDRIPIYGISGNY